MSRQTSGICLLILNDLLPYPDTGRINTLSTQTSPWFRFMKAHAPSCSSTTTGQYLLSRKGTHRETRPIKTYTRLSACTPLGLSPSAFIRPNGGRGGRVGRRTEDSQRNAFVSVGHPFVFRTTFKRQPKYNKFALKPYEANCIRIIFD